MCEDYRAGATIDFALDRADYGHKRIACPTLVLWSSREEIYRDCDVLAIWREWASEVEGHALDVGHHLAEEAPDATFAALHAFFAL